MSLLWLLLFLPIAFGAPLPKPLPNTYIHDFANVLTDGAKVELQKQAKYLKDNLNTEIAVVMMETLNGEDAFDYSLNLAREWGIGSKDNEVRGLLILVVVKDRKTSIRTSRHLEGQLNDGITGEINREMNTYFKKGDFSGGLGAGMTKIINRLTETQADTQPVVKTGKSSSGWLWVLILIPVGAGAGGVYLIRKRRRERAIEERGRQVDRNRAAYFTPLPAVQSGKQKKKKKKESQHAESHHSATPSYESQSSSYSSSHDSSNSSSSSYDYGSSSSSSTDSGSSYSGGSDFGGGGSDSSW